jgi:thiosulfate dehydrogenase [quinone] large subunit
MNTWATTPLRKAAVVLGAIAALTLFYLENPWANPTGDMRALITWAFWIASIGLVVVLFMERKDEPERDEVQIEGPAFLHFLFNNRRAALIWLPIRLFVGFAWLEAGWHKFTGTGWMDGGGALLGYWQHAVAIPAPGAGSPSITFEWYRSFLQVLIDNNAQTWFAPLITFGEMAVGLGVLLGALTGIAAFFGAFMNMSFLLAGSASTNPIMFSLAVGLILAWKVAGYYGLDRYLLPALGAPWKPGSLVKRGTASAAPPAAPAATS